MAEGRVFHQEHLYFDYTGLSHTMHSIINKTMLNYTIALVFRLYHKGDCT